MAIRVRNSELLLKLHEVSAEVKSRINKYESYLEALYYDEYAFHRDAAKIALTFLLADNYPNIESLAQEYHKAMGWDAESGTPTEGTVEVLGLKDLVQSFG